MAPEIAEVERGFMLGIVDVGGGMRDSFGAGILDFCLDEGIVFDLAVGVSAGSGNLANFVAGQRGRTMNYYLDYAFRKEYMSMRNLLKKKNYVDLDYAYGTLSNSDGEDPLDYEAFVASPTDYRVVATEAETGHPHIFTKADMKRDNYAPIKASSCVPVINQAYPVDGRRYYDGGLSNPIPLDFAFDQGCDKIVLILTRPRDYNRSAKDDERSVRIIKRKFPETAATLAARADTYNRQLAQAKVYEQEGKVLILAPDNIDGMDMLKKDKDAIQRLYDEGMKAAEAIPDFIRQ